HRGLLLRLHQRAIADEDAAEEGGAVHPAVVAAQGQRQRQHQGQARKHGPAPYPRSAPRFTTEGCRAGRPPWYKPPMQYPDYRPRRLRRTETLRRLVRETRLSPGNFIYPL